MFYHLKNYFYSESQKRINNRIDSINQKRLEQKRAGKKVSKLTKGKLYPNKTQKIIKLLTTNDIDVTSEFLSPAIANSILFNMKYMEDKVIYQNEEDKEGVQFKKEKRENLEFLNVSEIYWGTDEEMDMFSWKFHFLANLFRDILDHQFEEACFDREENREKARELVEETLQEYVPYASYQAYEQVFSQEDAHAEFIEYQLGEYTPTLLDIHYKEQHVNAFEGAIFYFCQLTLSDTLVDKFSFIINQPLKYESKEKKRFVVKYTEANFRYFDPFIISYIEYTLIPILEYRKNFIQFSLGKRVYQLIVQDLEMESFIEFQNLTNGKNKDTYDKFIESEAYILGLIELLEASSSYRDRLSDIQLNSHGDIELQYFNSEVFKEDTSDKYFSSQRSAYLKNLSVKNL